MIAANELRIGNLIYFPSTSERFEQAIVSIGPEAVNGFDFEECDPIPITEEWLLKFGFTRHHNDYFNRVILIKNVVDFDSGEPQDEFEFLLYPNLLGSAETVRDSIKLKYIHHVQNIFFSLTGKELQHV